MDVWVINWRNFIAETDPAKLARPLDPQLARQLSDLPNEDPPHLRLLASRNLRRSYVLNIPTAQSVLAELASDGDPVAPLGETELIAGAAGQALRDNGYAKSTPLWFYILAEAATTGGGARLGPLGSLIVAETLLGLIATDPESYWNTAGSDAGRWHPSDAGIGADIDSFEALFTFAGVL